MLLIGIDEAGYGPLLGPLCHGLCVLRLPGEAASGAPDLWRTLAPAVARCPAPPNALPVDDSKAVYHRARDLAALRVTVECFLRSSAIVALWPQAPAVNRGRNTAEGGCATVPGGGGEGHLAGSRWSRGELLQSLLAAEDLQDVEADPWGRPAGESEEGAGVDVGQASCLSAWEAALQPRLAALLSALRETNVEVRCCAGRALSARGFNARLAALGNKADVTWERVAALLARAAAEAARGEEVLAVVDRQGGRKFYAAHLTGLFAGSFVSAEEESPAVSRYRLERDGAPWRVEFREQAERACLPVALASMTAKLVRELMMERFNAFFHAHQPEVKPTAGYVQDARRFLAETAELRGRLGIRDADVIRQR